MQHAAMGPTGTVERTLIMSNEKSATPEPEEDTASVEPPSSDGLHGVGRLPP